MDLQGKGRKLTESDINNLSREFGVSPAHVRTVMEVESKGEGFNSMGMVTFLFERHVFYKQLKDKSKKDRAIREGLATITWQGPGSYPKGEQARWDQFVRAGAIDQHAAYMSASYGLGQVMGFNHSMVGYDTVEEMVADFAESEYAQLRAMLRFIQRRGLIRHLQSFPDMKACRAFALGYNGTGYEKNSYHTKLHNAYNRWAKRLESEAPILAQDGVLRMGSAGPRVRALQVALKDKGYSIVGRIDDKYGRQTRDAVNAWKSDNGMQPNGEMDQHDLLALDNSPPRLLDPDRTEATVKEVAKESSIVNESNIAMKAGGWITGTAIAAKGADDSGILDKAQDLADRGEQVAGIWEKFQYVLGEFGIAPFLKLISAYAPWIFGGLCVAGVVVFFRIREKRMNMHREGELG